MPELKDQIRTYFETVAPPVQVRPDPRQTWLRLRPLMAWSVGVAVVAVPTLVLWVLFGRGVEPESTVPPATTVTTIVETTVPPDTTVTTVPQTTTPQGPPTTAVPEVGVDTIGQWTPIPDAPAAMSATVQVWTGEEVIVWGDAQVALDQPAIGFAYNVSTGVWREIAPAPQARQQPAAVWTGTQLLVWGGDGWDGENAILTDDGLAYDPTTDVWTPIPAAPLSPRSHPFHVWTGEELIVWGGMEFIEEFNLTSGTTGGAAYNPETNTWRSLPEAPSGARNPGVMVWTGTVMIIGGNGDQTDGDASWIAYSPETDSWTQLPDPPVRAGNVYTGVWTGTEVIFSSDDGSSGSSLPTSEFYAFNPASNVWRQTASPGKSVLGAGAVWTGHHVIYWGESGYPGDEFTEIAYDPAGDTWRTLAPSPLSDRFAHDAITIIGPGVALVWGGSDYGPGGFSDGAVLVIDGPRL